MLKDDEPQWEDLLPPTLVAVYKELGHCIIFTYSPRITRRKLWEQAVRTGQGPVDSDCPWVNFVCK